MKELEIEPGAQRVIDMMGEIENETAVISLEVFKEFAKRFVSGDESVISAWIGLAGSYFSPVKVVVGDGKSFTVPPMLKNVDLTDTNINYYGAITEALMASETNPAISNRISTNLIKTLMSQVSHEDQDKVHEEGNLLLRLMEAVLDDSFDINKLVSGDIEVNTSITNEDDDIWD